jgi:glycosyltransferase involved in cell wall biosynthesis
MIQTPIDNLNGLIYPPTDTQPFSGALWQRYFDPVPELSYDLPVPILGIMLLIWQLRDKDLQTQYPLDTKASRLAFIAWCIVSGRAEYKALEEATILWDALDSPYQLPDSVDSDYAASHGLSWLMVLVANSRPDLGFDLSNDNGCCHFVLWYLHHGIEELGLANRPLPDWQVDFLLSNSAWDGLNRLQTLIYAVREDVSQAFPLPSALSGFLAWYQHFIAVETRLGDLLTTKPSKSPVPYRAKNLPFGVNVIGYTFAQMGIGEDARMAARSLLTTDIPVTSVNFPPGTNTFQDDLSMVGYVSPKSKYAVNLFCLPGLEQARFFAVYGKEALDGYYNIGYWPWELSEWPEDWLHLLVLVDEIWVYSQHVHDALAPVSPVPVRIMSVAVEIGEVSPLTRNDFALPQNATLFLFVFDLNSVLHRKNPEACINAFLMAFPQTGPDALDESQVGLVIKVHPPKTPNPQWDALKQLQACDPRIHLIEETLGKSDLLALYQLCDCFVSLHRAEGFGRCIAEAMLLGKPVIVTGYSGNLAFTGNENALLVNYKPLPLADDDYPCGRGQMWAEPDIAHAATHMQKISADKAYAGQLGLLGQNTIMSRHNLEFIGSRYADALHEIDLTSCGQVFR